MRSDIPDLSPSTHPSLSSWRRPMARPTQTAVPLPPPAIHWPGAQTPPPTNSYTKMRSTRVFKRGFIPAVAAETGSPRRWADLGCQKCSGEQFCGTGLIIARDDAPRRSTILLWSSMPHYLTPILGLGGGHHPPLLSLGLPLCSGRLGDQKGCSRIYMYSRRARGPGHAMNLGRLRIDQSL
jgi:hypothetical protein